MKIETLMNILLRAKEIENIIIAEINKGVENGELLSDAKEIIRKLRFFIDDIEIS